MPETLPPPADAELALTTALSDLIDRGLTFGRTIEMFAARQGETHPDVAAVIAQAWERHGEEGEIEIDENAILSASEDGGDYVMAWVWVPHPPTTADDDPETPADVDSQDDDNSEPDED